MKRIIKDLSLIALGMVCFLFILFALIAPALMAENDKRYLLIYATPLLTIFYFTGKLVIEIIKGDDE